MSIKLDINNKGLVEVLTQHPIAHVSINPMENPEKVQLVLSAENYVFETFELFPSKNVAGIQILFLEKGHGLLIPLSVLEYVVDTVRSTETIQ